MGLNMLVYQLVDLATYPTLVLGYAEYIGFSVRIDRFSVRIWNFISIQRLRTFW